MANIKRIKIGDTTYDIRDNKAVHANVLGTNTGVDVIIHNSTTNLPAVVEGAILIAYDA